MATSESYIKIAALPPVPKGFTGDPEIWRFMEALRQRVGGDSGDLIYNAAYDASQSAASLEPLVYAVAQEVQTSLEGQIRAIIEEAQNDRIDVTSGDNNATPLPNPEQFSFDDFPIGALIQQTLDNSPVQSVFGRVGDVIAVEGDYDLTELGDVTITAPSATQGLIYNGSTWVNAAITATAFTGTLPVANGGTGQSALTANNVILGNGTAAVQFVAPGTSGNVLTSNGTTWQSSAPSGGSAPDYETAVATAAQTVFNTTLSTVANGSGKNYLMVTCNGLVMDEGGGNDYTVTGANQITFTSGRAINDKITFRAF